MNESYTLAECEQVIQNAQQRFFVDTGQALMIVRDNRLYLADYDTFAAYTEDRWAIKRRHADELIQAAKVAMILSATALKIELPSSEREARGLAKLLPSTQDTEAEQKAAERRLIEVWISLAEKDRTPDGIKAAVTRALEPSPEVRRAAAEKVAERAAEAARKAAERVAEQERRAAAKAAVDEHRAAEKAEYQAIKSRKGREEVLAQVAHVAEAQAHLKRFLAPETGPKAVGKQAGVSADVATRALRVAALPVDIRTLFLDGHIDRMTLDELAGETLRLQPESIKIALAEKFARALLPSGKDAHDAVLTWCRASRSNQKTFLADVDMSFDQFRELEKEQIAQNEANWQLMKEREAFRDASQPGLFFYKGIGKLKDVVKDMNNLIELAERHPLNEAMRIEYTEVCLDLERAVQTFLRVSLAYREQPRAYGNGSADVIEMTAGGEWRRV